VTVKVELFMSKKEANRLHLMKVYEKGHTTMRKVTEELGLSLRQGRRLWKKYKESGERALISQRRGVSPPNKTPEGLVNQVLALIHEKYHDYGPTLVSEKLQHKHNICLSRESLRQLMIQDGIWRVKRKKELKYYQRRARRPRFGELVQIDGSHHDWLEGRGEKCCLLVFVDDATGKLLECYFCNVESTENYMTSMKSYLKRYGRPLAFYSDKHSTFRVNQGVGQTQLGRALKELDIDLIYANSPQAKGRVERKNGLLQDRLIKEMRENRIASIEDANRFLPHFIKWHNKRFGKPPHHSEDAHRGTEEYNLEEILTYKTQRKLSKELSMQYNNELYQIQGTSHRLRGAYVDVIESRGKVKIIHRGSELKYKTWKEENYQKPIMGAKDLEALWPSKAKRKVHKHHPWK
jgi:transposase